MHWWTNLKCSDLWQIADSYLDGELQTETNHAVIAHLERCLSCRRELSASRELRSRLRAAFIHAPELDEAEGFAERLKSLLRAST
jgi:anti-sigma factor RsiW